jgi:hypothetical protein
MFGHVDGGSGLQTICLRQPAFLWDAELLRAKDVQRKPGTTSLPVLLMARRRTDRAIRSQSRLFERISREVILKVANVTALPREVRINLAGAKQIPKGGEAYVLASPDLKAENSLNKPMKVAPVEQQFAVPSGEFTFTLAANSLTVLRVGVAGK